MGEYMFVSLLMRPAPGVGLCQANDLQVFLAHRFEPGTGSPLTGCQISGKLFHLLCLSFPICKVGVMTALASLGCCEG